VDALDRSTAAVSEDGALLALEAELGDLVAQLLAAQEASGEHIGDQLPSASDTMSGGTENASVREAQAKRVEAILARLYPIERAIMAAPACTVVGLGVKARHAAYVMSQYWEEPAGKIDWEAQVVRLLIEAVCEVARTPSSFLMRER
jgi:phage tail tape-measure protein